MGGFFCSRRYGYEEEEISLRESDQQCDIRLGPRDISVTQLSTDSERETNEFHPENCAPSKKESPPTSPRRALPSDDICIEFSRSREEDDSSSATEEHGGTRDGREHSAGEEYVLERSDTLKGDKFSEDSLQSFRYMYQQVAAKFESS
eukprot:GEMP01069590.1.p1 GENE.GEMP01069590.1~~GEMP01069590.1.p1  ORF type:complete len:148 (+),score=32.29 GEMP01069590.1:29-472(+)